MWSRHTVAEQINGALHVSGDFSVKIPVSQFASVTVKAFHQSCICITWVVLFQKCVYLR